MVDETNTASNLRNNHSSQVKLTAKRKQNNETADSSNKKKKNCLNEIQNKLDDAYLKTGFTSKSRRSRKVKAVEKMNL